jgi:hypothetical protein
VFVARPPSLPPRGGRYELYLLRAERRSFPGPAVSIWEHVDPAGTGEYLADMLAPYGRRVTPGVFDGPGPPTLGQSYGEMARAVIGATVRPDEPVDLLVLAFSVHDMLPGRATAAYLSHLCPGTPMSFAVCDQGSAATFSGLRMIRATAASTGCRRALLVVLEQAELPYRTGAPLPTGHHAVAMLYGDESAGDAARLARVVDVRQHAGIGADRVADLATDAVAELSVGADRVRVVLSESLAARWPAHPAGEAGVAPPGQPSTGVWWRLLDRLPGAVAGSTGAGGAGTAEPGAGAAVGGGAAAGPDAGAAAGPDAGAAAGLVVVADYDAGLGYACLTAMRPG